MIFDLISIVILFHIVRVFSRLIEKRHDDVLYHVSRQY
jgi:hypothetical protein